MIDKQTLLLQTALELFASEGLTVPTATIAKVAGVANGTLFNYFPTKQKLVDGLYLDIKTEVGQMFLELDVDPNLPLRQVFELVWQNYINWAIKNPLKHKVMNQLKSANMVSTTILTQTEEGFKPLHALVLRGIQNNEILDIDTNYLYQIMSAQIEASILQALSNKFKGAVLINHIALGFKIYWNGISP